jgi:hypothetical protein
VITPPFLAQLSEIAAIKATLLKQPDALYDARRAQAEADRALRTAKKRLADLEAAAADRLADLAALVGGDDRYKNEAQRKARVRELGKTDPELAVARAAVQEQEAVVLQAEMAAGETVLLVKRREDEQRAWRSHLDATQCEVSLLVAGR